MPRFKIWHLHEQGQDMIIVPLDRSFGMKSQADQEAAMAELQMRSASAGLRGAVAAVWPSGNRMMFRAPQPWHAFFRSLNLGLVQANLNREIYW